MNKVLLLVMACLLSVSLSAQVKWHKISTTKSDGKAFHMVSATEKEQVIQFDLSEYGTNEIQTQQGSELVFRIKKGARLLDKGAPDLDKVTQSIIIDQSAATQIEVVSADFIELTDVRVAPSKGVLTRAVNPDEIPYEYGDVYQKDTFYPGKLAELAEAYNIRDLRGQAISLYPYQYNPVTKTMKVYTSITVKVTTLAEEGANPLPALKSTQQIDPVFHSVYGNHFLNYASLKYTPIQETGGKMLIICHDAFASQMQPFVDYKTSIGFQVQMVNYSTIGSSAALKTYVANHYNTNGLTYLLIVGDNAQVPTSSTSGGDSDNNYGYIVGNDHYLDIFVGRFSAESAAEVTTMVNRTLYYERDMSSSDAIITKGVGIASNEGTGGGGDMDESDEQHMNNIQTDLNGYGYTITKCYQDGGSTSQLSTLINNGTGLINYVGHGGDYNWVAPNFTTTNVNALTNTNKYPFIISVACVVGNFKTKTCFAESWIRATHNGSPSGALVFCGSTINQSWASPMRAQDEMNDLLVANSFKTYGGMFVNGMFKMIDAYNADGEKMADTWTCFGDPSVQTRTPGHPDSPGGGTPPCGIPANLQSSALTNTSATVSWGAVTGAQSYVLAYKASAATSWTEVTQTATSKSLSGLTAGTAYDFKVKTNCDAGASAFSAIANFTTTGGSQDYCNSTSNNASYEWISGVTFGSYTHTSTGAGYTDFTGETVSMPIGGSVSVELTPGFKSTTYTEYWKVFIDFNGDKDFADAGEEVFSANGKAAVTGTINVPASASGSTRMRVVMKYNAAPLNSCETYDYGETEDYTVNFGNQTITYCSSKGNNSSYEWISGVTVGTFTKTSTAAGYTDFTGEQINLQAGNNYSVALTPGFASSAYMEHWKIWIDLNANGDFTDAGEELYTGSGTAAVNGSISIPASASGTTRMRVSMKYNAVQTSCEAFSYGEVEDYTVNIARTRDMGAPLQTVSDLRVYPNPNKGEFYLNLSGEEGDVKVSITSITGAIVYRNAFAKPQGEFRQQVNVKHLVRGTYIVIVKQNGKVMRANVVIR